MTEPLPTTYEETQALIRTMIAKLTELGINNDTWEDELRADFGGEWGRGLDNGTSFDFGANVTEG